LYYSLPDLFNEIFMPTAVLLLWPVFNLGPWFGVHGYSHSSIAQLSQVYKGSLLTT
jgi:hypothetical protein